MGTPALTGYYCWWVGGVGVEQKVFFGLAKITYFVFLVLLKDRGCRVSSRFHLFVSDVNQGNKEMGWAQHFLAWNS